MAAAVGATTVTSWVAAPVEASVEARFAGHEAAREPAAPDGPCVQRERRDREREQSDRRSLRGRDHRYRQGTLAR